MSPKDTAGTRRGDRLGAVTPGRIAIAVVAVLLLVFIFENTRQVRIRLLIPEVTMPLYLALLATALLGAVCGWYAARRGPRRSR
ncbi:MULTISPECIES: lipopolysaccharide assembly protein LapA domain-containing protein [unclassified Streptomyces]|uniref:lipopolysaccharide assembly protein LapA domain-containing protein n=1 Tax=unclassified Streptomyces TaxID=2593676 RepID=UPI0004C6756F|nr:lipopolysaccharide assembly protein LapA domain-containing protein [Streptomyces sp. NRRL F-5727]